MIAGERRQRSADQPSLVVDYRDVLDQAVLNERYRVLREVRREVEAIPTKEGDHYGMTGWDVKQRTLRAISQIEQEPRA